jgi:hypothetical protein
MALTPHTHSPTQNNVFPDSYWEMSCLNPNSADNYVVGCTGTITFRPDTTPSTYVPADIISFGLQYLDEAESAVGVVTGMNGAKNMNDVWVELATSESDFQMNFSYKKGKGCVARGNLALT